MNALAELLAIPSRSVNPPKPERDRQRSKVYKWEQAADLDRRKMTWPEIQAIANEICDAYRISRVEIGDGRGRRSGCYSADLHEIRLPLATRHLDYVLHELAHAITYRRDEEAHGPRFMRVLLDLHARWSSTSVRPARAMATKMRLRVAPSKDVPTPIAASNMRRIATINREIEQHEKEIAKLRGERAALRNSH